MEFFETDFSKDYYTGFLEYSETYRTVLIVLLTIIIVSALVFAVYFYCFCKIKVNCCYLENKEFEEIQDGVFAEDYENLINNSQILEENKIHLATLEGILTSNRSIESKWKEANLFFIAHETLKEYSDALLKMAEFSYKYAQSLRPEKRVTPLTAGKNFAHSALHHGGNDVALVHKWYAIFVTTLAMDNYFLYQLLSGIVAMKHLQKTFKMGEGDAYVYHLIGWWLLKFYETNWFTRLLFFLYYGFMPPTAKIKEARQHFIQAAMIAPKWADNIKWLTKCFQIENKKESCKLLINLLQKNKPYSGITPARKVGKSTNLDYLIPCDLPQVETSKTAEVTKFIKISGPEQNSLKKSKLTKNINPKLSGSLSNLGSGDSPKGKNSSNQNVNETLNNKTVYQYCNFQECQHELLNHKKKKDHNKHRSNEPESKQKIKRSQPSMHHCQCSHKQIPEKISNKTYNKDNSHSDQKRSSQQTHQLPVYYQFLKLITSQINKKQRDKPLTNVQSKPCDKLNKNVEEQDNNLKTNDSNHFHQGSISHSNKNISRNNEERNANQDNSRPKKNFYSYKTENYAVDLISTGERSTFFNSKNTSKCNVKSQELLNRLIHNSENKKNFHNTHSKCKNYVSPAVTTKQFFFGEKENTCYEANVNPITSEQNKNMMSLKSKTNSSTLTSLTKEKLASFSNTCLKRMKSVFQEIQKNIESFSTVSKDVKENNSKLLLSLETEISSAESSPLKMNFFKPFMTNVIKDWQDYTLSSYSVSRLDSFKKDPVKPLNFQPQASKDFPAKFIDQSKSLTNNAINKNEDKESEKTSQTTILSNSSISKLDTNVVHTCFNSKSITNFSERKSQNFKINKAIDINYNLRVSNKDVKKLKKTIKKNIKKMFLHKKFNPIKVQTLLSNVIKEFSNAKKLIKKKKKNEFTQEDIFPLSKQYFQKSKTDVCNSNSCKFKKRFSQNVIEAVMDFLFLKIAKQKTKSEIKKVPTSNINRKKSHSQINLNDIAEYNYDLSLYLEPKDEVCKKKNDHLREYSKQMILETVSNPGEAKDDNGYLLSLPEAQSSLLGLKSDLPITETSTTDEKVLKNLQRKKMKSKVDISNNLQKSNENISKSTQLAIDNDLFFSPNKVINKIVAVNNSQSKFCKSHLSSTKPNSFQNLVEPKCLKYNFSKKPPKVPKSNSNKTRSPRTFSNLRLTNSQGNSLIARTVINKNVLKPASDIHLVEKKSKNMIGSISQESNVSHISKSKHSNSRLPTPKNKEQVFPTPLSCKSSNQENANFPNGPQKIKESVNSPMKAKSSHGEKSKLLPTLKNDIRSFTKITQITRKTSQNNAKDASKNLSPSKNSRKSFNLETIEMSPHTVLIRPLNSSEIKKVSLENRVKIITDIFNNSEPSVKNQNVQILDCKS